MSIREAIRDANRLARMRQGQEAPEMTDIPSMPGIRCAQVPLTEAEASAGVIRAAALEVIDNQAGLQARNRAAIESDVWYSLREPDHLDAKVFASVEEMVESLVPTDIEYLADNLSALMDYASPAIDGLTDEGLAELKKAFGEIDWNALTGRQWAAVKQACQALFPALLLAKLRGSTSIE
jgi:hypothetical protein